MTHRKTLFVAVAAALAAIGNSGAFAHGQSTFGTGLNGYEETPNTLSTPGSGEFAAKISKDGTSIEWQLSYRDLESAVTQAHIHFARPGLSGGIVLFLCTNLGNAPAGTTVQACPAQPATISGTLTAVDVVAQSGQGIDGGATGFAEIISAIRAGATYANVHTVVRGSGEIRGGIGKVHDDDGDDDDDDD